MNVFESKNLFQVKLGLENWKSYVFTSLFVAGNLFFPWLVHNFGLGGPVFLPIYFFVLIAAYKFGWKVGVATAVLSPLANHFLTGVPLVQMLPVIFIKGVAMALIAAYVAKRTNKVGLPQLALVIVGYQAVGFVFELALTANLGAALQDIVVGYPGLLIQLVGGYVILLALRDYGRVSYSG
jgi:hypothetical protein